ncbi:unnamed protein product, partial [Dovyalis caffra]
AKKEGLKMLSQLRANAETEALVFIKDTFLASSEMIAVGEKLPIQLPFLKQRRQHFQESLRTLNMNTKTSITSPSSTLNSQLYEGHQCKHFKPIFANLATHK